MNRPTITKQEAKAAIIDLLIRQAKQWTFAFEEIPEDDQQVLREVRDEYVKQLEGNRTFAVNANRR